MWLSVICDLESGPKDSSAISKLFCQPNLMLFVFDVLTCTGQTDRQTDDSVHS